MVGFVFLILAGIVIFYLFERRKRIIENNKKILLNRKSSLNREIKTQFKTLSLIGTDCLFHFIYDLSRIDSDVIGAIQNIHSNSQKIDNVFDVINYTKSNILNNSLTQNAKDQIINKYKGYVGEEKHIDYLKSKGHKVTEADSPNQEGHDAIVDGEKINVKISNDSSYINKHLEEHPNIPVHTGEEFDHLQNVEGFSHLSNDVIENATESGMDAISNFGNSIQFPILLGMSSAIQNINKVNQENKNPQTAIEHVLTDIGSFSAGSYIGKIIGSSIMPVVGSFIGAIIGGWAGKRGGDYFKKRRLREAIEKANISCKKFIKEFVAQSPLLINKMRIQHKTYLHIIHKKRDQNFLLAFFNPSLKITFLQLARNKSCQESRKIINFYKSIQKQYKNYKSELEKNHKDEEYKEKISQQVVAFGYNISQLSPEFFCGDKQLLHLSNRIKKQIQQISIEKKKVA